MTDPTAPSLSDIMGNSGEYSPVQFPRPDTIRDAYGMTYKGSASQQEYPLEAVANNTTGNTNVPRHNDSKLDYWSDGDGPGVRDSDEYGGNPDGGRDVDM